MVNRKPSPSNHSLFKPLAAPDPFFKTPFPPLPVYLSVKKITLKTSTFTEPSQTGSHQVSSNPVLNFDPDFAFLSFHFIIICKELPLTKVDKAPFLNAMHVLTVDFLRSMYLRGFSPQWPPQEQTFSSSQDLQFWSTEQYLVFDLEQLPIS